MTATKEYSKIRENKSRVGEFIRCVRVERDMTQKKFSELTGISNEQICRIECGAIRPSVAYLKVIAGYLAKPLDDLLELSGYMGGITEEFNYTVNDGIEKIYMDTSGKSVDITKAGLKIYNKNPEFFTILNEDIEKISKEDVELLILFLKVRRKEDESDGDGNKMIKKMLCSFKTFLKDFLECTLRK